MHVHIIRLIANSAVATGRKAYWDTIGASVWRGFCDVNNIVFVHAAHGGAVAPTDIPQFLAVAIYDTCTRCKTRINNNIKQSIFLCCPGHAKLDGKQCLIFNHVID